MRSILIALALTIVASLPVGASEPSTDPVYAAAASCSSQQALCAARCKERAPTDKSCVSDHCTPKLNACRTSGCWQEGKQYGGQLICNLVRN